MAGDIKPVQIAIDSVANVFAGSEISRTEVQQFVRLMTGLTRVTKGSVILATHPSLTGLSDTSLSHEGLSGTTQWHNAVRARAVLKSIKRPFPLRPFCVLPAQSPKRLIRRRATQSSAYPRFPTARSPAR
jgi:hypothetical protein